MVLPAPFAAGQRDRRRLAQPRDIEFIQQGIELGFALFLGGFHHLQHRANILFHAEAAKNRRFLRQITDPEPGALVHWQLGDVAAVELDAALVGFDQPGRHVEDGGLAGAVRAEEADGFALAHIEADAFDHHAADEALLDAVDREHALALAARERTIAVAAAARPRRTLIALRRRLALGLPLGLPLRLTVELTLGLAFRRALWLTIEWGCSFRLALRRTPARRPLRRFVARLLFRRRRACNVEIGAVDLATDSLEINGDITEIVDFRRARCRRF